MKDYYVTLEAGEDGRHMVHEKDCAHGAEKEHQGTLGKHRHCEAAMKEAMRTKPDWDFNGCSFCCPDCHQG